MFANRADAGERLARRLLHLKGLRPVVLALPRGGVPVAAPVAAALDAPLDLILVRKLGAPRQPELAAGAVVDGERSEIVLNEDVVALHGISQDALRELAARELREIERRRAQYLGDRAPLSVKDRAAIVVDDGVATGATTRAALRAVRKRGPARLVLAVPVAPPDAAAELRSEVDELVCLATPASFGAVGSFYDDFRQVSDDEVVELLARAREREAHAQASDS